MPLPTHDFQSNEIKARYGANYASSEVNTKFNGVPHGIYMGFLPSVQAGSRLLTLGVDQTFGVSLARTQSAISSQDVDLVVDQEVVLDFTGHDFTADPTAYVKIRAEVDVGQPTVAEVFTDALPPTPFVEQLICVVTEVSGELAVADDEPANRSNPFAWTSAPYGYGFMKESAVEQLLAAVDMVNEVAAARLDLAGVTHPWNPPTDLGLDDRINSDLQPAAVAGRLALLSRVVTSNAHTIAVTASSFNASLSFSRFSRTALPARTFGPGGSETTPGAITGGDVEGRNICFLVTESTRERLVDSDRRVIYGRLTSATTALTGTLDFTNASTAVVGVGTAFLTELAVNSLIVAPDGEVYVVSVITDNFNLTLSAAYLGANATSAAATRTFTVSTFVNVAGAETSRSIPGGTTVRFFFPAWVLLSDPTFDSTNYMLASGEAQPLPAAAVGVKGRVLLHPGTTGGLGGAVLSVRDAGSVVGSGQPVWSIDFDGAAVSSPGVANVTAAGPTGPTGPGGGSPGPVGPTGPVGAGFDAFSDAFNTSPLYSTPFGGWASLTLLTHSVTYPSPPKYAHGGLARWEVDAVVVDTSDFVELTSVLVAGNTVNMAYTTPNLAIYAPPAISTIQLFINAAG
jgi:hypothetical protein